LIIRCAYGVPANMIQLPVSFGLSGNPVALGSNGQIIAQCGGSLNECRLSPMDRWRSGWFPPSTCRGCLAFYLWALACEQSNR
jgi:hypothetical protein